MADRYVQMPDGAYLEWPEGVSAEEFKAKASKYLPNAGLAPAAGAPPPKGTLPGEEMTIANAPRQIIGRINENMETMGNLPANVLGEARARFKAAREKGDWGGMVMAIPRTEVNTLENMVTGVGSVTAPGIAYRAYKKEPPANIIGDIAMFTAGTPEGDAAVTPGALKRALAPREIEIAGEKVPVLVGEAAPETRVGRMQRELKRAGAGEQQFKDFAEKQQAKVKQVIRNVAQQTSGMVGPMQDEPGAALHDAADATFAKARPMYKALDESLVAVPDAMEKVSAVTKQAIARAKKLGVEVTEGGGESVTINGRQFTPETDPVAWRNLQEQGLVPSQTGQPISTYMKVRSELLKMQRASADAAFRNAVGNEITAMNKNMETALKDTPLYENWTEANRLWSKGYAIRDVADALQKSTKGTPVAEQAKALTKKPTQVRGPELVRRLNDLQKNGILDRAFTPEEKANLRQSADILDRAYEKPGREFGFGYTLNSTITRNLVKLPGYNIVKAMTTVEGVNALKAVQAAKTPAEANAAAAKFAALAGTSAAVGNQINNRREALTALGR